MPAAVLPRRPAKKALCIGVEYIQLSNTHPKWDCKLNGTHKDTQVISELLQDVYGYQSQDIRILTDAEDSSCQPTKDNIIAAMNDLVRDACAGDHLLFHYSGHGSQLPAPPEHTEEIDGLDEVMWAADVQLDEDGEVPLGNFIIDDDVKKILVDKLPAGVYLAIILDCCSSGTGADLPYSSSASPFASPIAGRNPFTRPRGQSIISMPHNAHGIVGSEESVAIMALPSRKWSDSDRLPYVTSWSACSDDQLALENRSGGVFVKIFTEVLKESPYPTHAELLIALTRRLAARVGNEMWQTAKPQLGSIRDIRIVRDTRFEL